MTSWRVAACFARESNVHSGHGEGEPRALLGRPGDAHGTGCLDRCSRRRGRSFGRHAADFPDLSGPVRRCGKPDTRPARIAGPSFGVVASGGFTPNRSGRPMPSTRSFGTTKGDGPERPSPSSMPMTTPTSWTARVPTRTANWPNSISSSACPIRPASRNLARTAAPICLE